MSTHAIGPVRLLLGSLILLLAGAAAHWYLAGNGATNEVLVLRGGTLEIEPWAGDLTQEGSALVWHQAVNKIQLHIAKAENEDEEFVLLDPINIPEAAKLAVDLRVAKARTVSNAIVMALDKTGVKITVNEGQFAQKGDVWAYTGFLRQGRREPYEISRIEFRDAQDRVLSRYENPDLGRRVRFRVRLNGTAIERK